VRELRDEPRHDADGNEVPPPAPFTIRDIVATLRDLLDDAVDRRIIPSNPARSKLVRKQVPAAQTRAVQRAGQETVIYLPQAEAEGLLRYLLGLMTGLRDGEMPKPLGLVQILVRSRTKPTRRWRRAALATRNPARATRSRLART
jgi:hypothetical protein